MKMQTGTVKKSLDILKSKKATPVFISDRFQQIVTLHILKNMLKRSEVQVPLLLGIHGPSGEGKTFQCENILKNMGVKRFLLSGGQMDNPISGQPSRLIRDYYIRASDAIQRGECSMAVVLINDIDTGLGSWGDAAEFSLNQQMLFGELMHLVDYPTQVEGKDTLRVPIIITGNDFTKLYGPLVRAGRMESFEWIPTDDERAELVQAIFTELTTEECMRLVQELNGTLKDELPGNIKVLPVAFYAHLRSNLLDEDLWDYSQKTGLEKTIDIIIRGDEPDLTMGIYYDRILSKGIQLARSGQLINHIRAERER